MCYCVFVFLCFCVFVFLSKRERAAAKLPSREAVVEQTLPGCSDIAFYRQFLRKHDRGAAKWHSREAVFEQTLEVVFEQTL